MHIASRDIASSHSPYLIAELGVNHNGSVDRALALVDDAAAAGADAIKLQLFRAELLMSRAARLAAYQKSAGESDPLEMLRRLELSIDQMAPIVARAHERGVHAIVTVFSLELVESAQRLPFDAYKTASPDIIHKPLLAALAATTKPLIVSTGAATLAEVAQAAQWLAPAASEHRLALLQCVSSYPTDPADAALLAINDLHPLCPVVGYSDHTAEEDTGALAVRCGAALLEKHLTYDRAAQGPDHAASLDPPAFARYAGLARDAHPARVNPPPPGSDPRLGSGKKAVQPCEQDVRAVSRQSITATRDLPAGHRLTRADLTFKRPGTGLAPHLLETILNQPLAADAQADMPLTLRHVSL